METLCFLFTSTFYPPYHIGGDAIHVKYLAEELARNGHEVHVLHSMDAYRLKKRISANKNGKNGVYTHTVKTLFNSSSYFAYAFGHSSSVIRKFKALVDEIKPEIVHHHNISLLGYNILKKQREYTNIHTTHDFWFTCQQNNLMKNGLAICENPSCILCALKCRKPPQVWRHLKGFSEALSNIDLLIAPSNYIKSRNLGGILRKTVIIPNFAPKPPDKIIPSGYSNFFLYAGVLEKHKGILNLINLFKGLKIDAKLLVAGNGSFNLQIQDFIKKFGLKNKIVLLGWKEYEFLCRLLKDANALLVPSICPENNPMVALEALSVGTPVIASNTGGLPEIVEKVDKNLIFDNIDAFRDILISFSKEAFSANRIKSIYERNFSPEAYKCKYFKAIKNV